MVQDANSTDIEHDSTTINQSDDSMAPSHAPGATIAPGLVYSAVYAGTKVIEMAVRDGVSVMRRKDDSSFNATQILRAAGLDAAASQAVLDKEVAPSERTEVKNGYSKFQGVWIPYDKAVALAQQYTVYEDLKPLFLHAGTDDVPNREEALIAAKKNLNYNDSLNGLDGLLSASSINKQQSLSRSFSTLTENDENDHHNGISDESPTKKAKLNANTDGSTASTDPIEVYTHDLHIDNSNFPFALEPLSKFIPEYEHSKEIITQIFLNHDKESLIDAAGGEEELTRVNIDVSIDELGHTALHWAASLARIPLVKELVSNGSVRVRGNLQGETPLIRAVLVTNNYDNGTFNELLNLLYPCIPLLDHQRRSILHHIALTAGIKRRSAASRYYLETLLEWIVKIGSNLSSNGITLGKFMNEIVNAQDRNGDTCLNIAARIGNKAIVQQLLDVGADPSIPNKAGLKPIDFGINVNGLKSANPHDSSLSAGNTSNTSTSYNTTSNNQSSEKILNSMQQVLLRLDSDFKAEISAREKKLGELREQLRESTIKLSNTRKNVEFLKNSEIKLNEVKQKILNIDKAIYEEEQNFLNQTTDLGSFGDNVNFDPDDPFRVVPIYNELEKKNSIKEEELIKKINLSELPPSVVIKARITAYKQNEENLNNIILKLKENSSSLESKFRRVVALCTGVEEAKIDDILDGLVQAVESDPDEVDMTRVMGFLKKVDDK